MTIEQTLAKITNVSLKACFISDKELKNIQFQTEELGVLQEIMREFGGKLVEIPKEKETKKVESEK